MLLKVNWNEFKGEKGSVTWTNRINIFTHLQLYLRYPYKADLYLKLNSLDPAKEGKHRFYYFICNLIYHDVIYIC